MGGQRARRAVQYGSAVRVGVVILPEHPWPEARELWLRAEALGVDHVWTYDHLSWRSLRDGPWHEAVATLAAAAVVTERVRLGPLVASPNFRHPVPFARELITLDDLSGGRLVLGIGAGGLGWDATTLGHEAWSPRERADRFEEFVILTDLLLRQPVTTWSGRYYAAHEARSAPGCRQQPRLPFAVAAAGPRSRRLAAEHGQWWVTVGERDRPEPATVEESVAYVAREVEAVEATCAEVGRDPTTLDRMVVTGLNQESGLGSAEELTDTLGRYQSVGITDVVVHWPRPGPPYQGDEAHFEAVVGAVCGS
jgi:alkanesulfonate monooxygenase SsuD/methylene tetrahydromethanopterin reductase-like flavin-dependent oxidoreductase (luciferase family)